MKAIVRGGLVAALALTVTAATFADAEAQSRRGRVVGGVAAGLIIGGLVAGAAAANARERGTYYVAPAPRASCGEYKRRAIWNEENGRGGRAQYWWDQYESCIGG
jgi:MFS family permease